MLKNMKLRTRLTLFMAVIMFCACLVLTLTLIFSADKIYQTTTATPSIYGSIIEHDTQINDVNTTKDQSSYTFRIVGFISIILVFVTGTGVTYAMAGKALSPITDLSRSIGTIDENNLFMPVRETTSGDEVSKLAVSFNSMIRKLEKAFISQKHFSANAAHELKTPLAAMISRIEVCQLDENPSTAEYKDTLSDVIESAGRLSSLVNDLLEMNASPSIEKREDVDAMEMFNQIITDVSKNNIKEVHLENEVDGIYLSGDKRLLYRAFLNIIQNAVKYNVLNGKVIISAERKDGKSVITVSDTGIGIPADQLDKIFDPFYCVDKSRVRQLGGSGLGLALVKSIIDKHGGNVYIASKLGASTTVTVILP